MAPAPPVPPVRGQTRFILSPSGYPDSGKLLSGQPVILQNERQELFPQQQQQQQNVSTFYPTEPPRLNHHKMRSPKHRVLQQREYLSGNLAQAQPQNPGGYFSPRSPQPSTPIHQHSHLHQQRNAPYSIPASSSSTSTSSSSQQQQQDLTADSELRQLLKSSTPASASAVIKPEYSAPVEHIVPGNRFLGAAGNFLASHSLTRTIPPPLSSDLPQSLATSSIRGLGGIDDLSGHRGKQTFRGLTHTQQYQVSSFEGRAPKRFEVQFI